MQTYINLVGFMGFKLHPEIVEDFFMHVLKENVKEREKSGIRRNDLLDLLIDLRNTKDPEGHPGISYNEIVAVLFGFFGAGYETTWITISYALYELARCPEVQEKARQQILAKLKEHNSEFSYEASMEMPYLDQIICETIRLYPTLSYLERHPTEDYPIPDSNIVLDKGTAVYIPVHSIHYDPEIYENPEEFRPDRFHPAEVAKRHPQSFLGFGDGPRNCIGLRFGRVQVLVALVSLLSNYRFSVCEKTVDKFILSDHTFTLRPMHDIYLKVDKLGEI